MTHFGHAYITFIEEHERDIRVADISVKLPIFQERRDVIIFVDTLKNLSYSLMLKMAKSLPLSRFI